MEHTEVLAALVRHAFYQSGCPEEALDLLTTRPIGREAQANGGNSDQMKTPQKARRNDAEIPGWSSVRGPPGASVGRSSQGTYVTTHEKRS